MYSPRAATTNKPTNRAPNEPPRPICAQESIFGGKNGHFWAKHPNYVEREQKFWYPLIRKPLTEAPRLHCFIGWTKIPYLPYHPKICQWPVCSPLRGGPFRTLGLIFFQVTAIFVKKKKKAEAPKSPPTTHPTVRAPYASNSPSALSAPFI